MSFTHELVSQQTPSPRGADAAFILRLALGIALLAHGLLKVLVFTLAGTVAFFDSVGFPGWLAYPVTLFEVLGGVLLLVGWYVRPVAILAVFVLIGAASVHLGNGWVFSNEKGGWEYPVFLAVVAVTVALAGEGRFALSLGRGRQASEPAGQA